jgi:hypothetical protein
MPCGCGLPRDAIGPSAFKLYDQGYDGHGIHGKTRKNFLMCVGSFRVFPWL